MPLTGFSQAGDAQNAEVTTLNIVVPATAAAGEAALLYVDANSTPSLSTPSGWTLDGTADAGSNARTWVFSRTLQSGDPGSTVGLTFGSSSRCVAEMQTFSGHTLTGRQIANLPQASATGTFTLPTLSSVPAGAMLSCGFWRRRVGVAATITVPSPYTETVEADTGTEYGSGANCYGTSGRAVTASGGTVGGESATSGITSLGVNWLVALPAASAAPGQGTFTGTTTTAAGPGFDGKRVAKGTAAGTSDATGPGFAGTTQPKGAATGTVTAAGTFDGSRSPKATAGGTTEATGSGFGGRRDPQGAFTGAVTTTGPGFDGGTSVPAGTFTGTVDADGPGFTGGRQAQGTAAGAVTVASTGFAGTSTTAAPVVTHTYVQALVLAPVQNAVLVGGDTVAATLTGDGVSAAALAPHVGRADLHT